MHSRTSDLECRLTCRNISSVNYEEEEKENKNGLLGRVVSFLSHAQKGTFEGIAVKP